jgi:NAD(P)-dependent dehydrogenase (short-subunit alcohol dehydrogenase family)
VRSRRAKKHLRETGVQGRVPTILITGATDGIGRQTALELAATGANLIVHGRDVGKLERLVDELGRVPGHGEIAALRADLADLEQVRALARELLERFDRLDVLLNNAGVVMNGFVTTPQGHEATWGINVLAPMLLTHLLLSRLRESDDGGRVVNVSSIAHNRGSANWDEVDSPRGFVPYSAYSRSKLALTVLTVELARRVGERPLLVSLHPGVVSTKLLTEGLSMQGPDSLHEGAATSVYLATAPISQLRKHQGGYFVRSQPAATHPLARDGEAGARLHALVCRSLGIADSP